MPRVLLIPAVGAWSFSFDEGQMPLTLTLPAGAFAGDVIFTASTTGDTPVDPQGAIGTVVIDGGAPQNTACLDNGSQAIAIPANTTTIALSIAKGCGAGVDPTTMTISGVGA